MKVALITDTHWGARSDSQWFLNYFKKFFDEIFFPYLKENNINYVFHLGDLVDRRKYINYNTLNFIRENFLDRLEGRYMHIIPGNHDIYFRNTLEVNALNELLAGYSNINVIRAPTDMDFFRNKIAMLPWICDSNREASLRFLKESKAKILLGHLEINGFEMHRGSMCDFGLGTELFDRFKLVCSGHFHHRSSKGNIQYLGSPYEMTWVDCDDVRGFHIYDLDSEELTFIPNPLIMHKKVIHKGKIVEGDYSNKYVRLMVNDKTNLDEAIKYIEDQNPIALSVIEERVDLKLDKKDNPMEDPRVAIISYLDSVDWGTKELKQYMTNLYEEALRIEK